MTTESPRLRVMKERRDKIRHYALKKGFTKVELDLCEDMLDMLENGLNWDEIKDAFSSPRVAHWVKDQLYNAGIPTGLPE